MQFFKKDYDMSRSVQDEVKIYNEPFPEYLNPLYDLLDDIDAAIAAIADPLQKAIIQIEYQESTTFERNSPNVVAMLGILGLSDVQANEMWLQGLAI